MISLSVALDPNKGIGYKGSLPWHIKEELQLFKANTIHKSIIMGRTTYDGLPRKLVDRKIYVVSNDYNYKPEDVIVIHDLNKFLLDHQNDEEEFVICGGASIYKASYPHIQKAYVSFVKKEYETDTQFSCFNRNDFKTIKEVSYEDFDYKELERV